MSGGSGQVIVYSTPLDSFNRVVATGLGTSDAGYTWVNTYGTTELSSVDGSQAILRTQAFTFATYSITDSGGPWTGSFTCTIKFTWPPVDPGGTQRLLCDVSDNPASETWYIRWKVDRNADILTVEWWDGAAGAFDQLQPVAITDGDTAFLKVSYDETTGVLQGKYWEQSLDEPDWQVSTVVGTLGEIPGFLMQFVSPGDLVTTYEMPVDYVDFGGAPVLISGR